MEYKNTNKQAKKKPKQTNKQTHKYKEQTFPFCQRGGGWVGTGEIDTKIKKHKCPVIK